MPSPEPDSARDPVFDRVTAVLNQKGGVGKTTVTLGLAASAAAAGRQVLVIDLDPQGSSSWVLGVDPDAIDVSVGDVLHKAPLADAIHPSTWSDALPGSVHVVPARADQQDLEDGKPRRLAKAIARCADGGFDLGRYEAILVDCPPSLGNLTRNALSASRHALIVVEPSALGLRGIAGVADTIDEVWDHHNPGLELSGVVLNRVPAVSTEAARRIDELARIVGRSAIWDPPIPQRVIFNQAVGERRPIHAYGRQVLVIDLDPQGSSSWVLGVDPDAIDVSVGDVLHKAPLADAIHPSTWSDALPGSVHVVPARADQQDLEDGKPRRLAKAIARCADGGFDLGRYEAILVDCPPSLGNLTRNALSASRHALIVVEPSALGLRGIAGVADTIDEVWDHHNPGLELSGVVLNRVPAVSTEAARRIDELARIVGRSAIWDPPIPQRVIFNQAVGERRPIHAYGSRAREPIEVFDRLWATLRRTVHG
ncbi:MAG: ParA family protein [Actinomycetota bacterium]